MARVAARVAHARVYQPLVREVFPVQVLNTPEAASRDGGFLGAFGERSGCPVGVGKAVRSLG